MECGLPKGASWFRPNVIARASVQKSLRPEDRRHHGLAASAKKSPSSWRMLLSHVTTVEPGCRLSMLNEAFGKMPQAFFPFIPVHKTPLTCLIRVAATTATIDTGFDDFRRRAATFGASARNAE